MIFSAKEQMIKKKSSLKWFHAKVRKIACVSHISLSKAHHMDMLNLKGSGNVNSMSWRITQERLVSSTADRFSITCLNILWRLLYILPVIDAQLSRHDLS